MSKKNTTLFKVINDTLKKFPKFNPKFKVLADTFKKNFRFNLNFKSNSDKDIFIHNDQNLLKITSSIIISSTFIFISFLTFAKTEEIIVVTGKIIPVGKVKDIKMPMAGVINTIRINEGEIVKKGQILMEIKLDTNTNLSKTLVNQVDLIENQISFLRSNFEEEIALYENKKKVLEQNLDIQIKILEKFKSYVLDGVVSELEVLNQEAKVNNLLTELVEFDLNLSEKTNITLSQIQNLNKSLNDLKGQLKENNLNIDNKLIRSPVKGYIFDLKPINPGYAAQMTETIVKVVPMGDLNAYLEVPSSDIGFIKKDMEVDISIDSYPSSDFGVIEGTITTIGKDSIRPEKGVQGSEDIYPVRVKLKSQKLNLKDSSQLDLRVGMSLKGNIKLRKVSYLRMLLSNFQTKTRSLQEL